jgi:hypothetical protein
MKIDKKTKILLGVGALAVAGYFIWKNNQPKDIFANASGRKQVVKGGDEIALGNTLFGSYEFRENCACSYGSPKILRRSDGTEITEYECGNGEHSNQNKGKKCCGGGIFPNCDLKQ